MLKLVLTIFKGKVHQQCERARRASLLVLLVFVNYKCQKKNTRAAAESWNNEVGRRAPPLPNRVAATATSWFRDLVR